MRKTNPMELYQEVTSVPRGPRLVYINRNHEEGDARLWANYFVENPISPPQMFRCRFRMCKHVFLCIVNVVTTSNSYFQQHAKC